MTDARVAELALAIAGAVAVLRFWRHLVALVLAAVLALTVIGLFTVLSWCGTGPRWWSGR